MIGLAFKNPSRVQCDFGPFSFLSVDGRHSPAGVNGINLAGRRRQFLAHADCEGFVVFPRAGQNVRGGSDLPEEVREFILRIIDGHDDASAT